MSHLTQLRTLVVIPHRKHQSILHKLALFTRPLHYILIFQIGQPLILFK